MYQDECGVNVVETSFTIFAWNVFVGHHAVYDYVFGHHHHTYYDDEYEDEDVEAFFVFCTFS
jgi:hypothetical protein